MSKKNRSQNKPTEDSSIIEPKDKNKLQDEIIVEIAPGEESSKKEDVKTVEESEPDVELQENEAEDISGYFVLLGDYPNNKLDIIKSRIPKELYSALKILDDQLVLGPFEKEECIKIRRLISIRGLKGKIISK